MTTECLRGHDRIVNANKWGQCRVCNRERARVTRKAPHRMAYDRAYSARYEVSDRRHDLRLRRVYGMTLVEFEAAAIAQNHQCRICGTPCVVRGKGRGAHGVFVVDHDHATGETRGLICNRCNTVLGFVDDDVELLASLIEYLRRV